MKFRVLNNEPLQFYNDQAVLTGTIQISSSGDMIIRPESGSSKTMIFGDTTTTGTVEFGTTAAPVTLNVLGGGLLTSNGNTLTIGAPGDTIKLVNTIFTQSIAVTGSVNVSGSVYAQSFIGNGSLLTGITHTTASYVLPLNQQVIITGSALIYAVSTYDGHLYPTINTVNDTLNADSVNAPGEFVSIDWQNRTLKSEGAAAENPVALDWATAGTVKISGSLGSYTTNNTAAVDAMLQATLLYLSNNF